MIRFSMHKNRGKALVAQENLGSSIAYLGLASLTGMSPTEAYPKGLFKDKIKSHNVNHLICYVFVLTLHVDKFKTNPEDIAKDLRMSNTLHLDKYFNNLGCKFVCED
ncbi:hypothetical protein V5N11_013589 [Cardamine amara subsp. amara]|uniref:Uncharacterized protein n=1 Tax=Cardamine amara subsp. amara TaxID=228776 RepID=A0ABD0ZLQ5_CARAN